MMDDAALDADNERHKREEHERRAKRKVRPSVCLFVGSCFEIPMLIFWCLGFTIQTVHRLRQELRWHCITICETHTHVRRELGLDGVKLVVFVKTE